MTAWKIWKERRNQLRQNSFKPWGHWHNVQVYPIPEIHLNSLASLSLPSHQRIILLFGRTWSGYIRGWWIDMKNHCNPSGVHNNNSFPMLVHSSTRIWLNWKLLLQTRPVLFRSNNTSPRGNNCFLVPKEFISIYWEAPESWHYLAIIFSCFLRQVDFRAEQTTRKWPYVRTGYWYENKDASIYIFLFQQ